MLENQFYEAAIANFGEPMKYQGGYHYELGNVSWNPKSGWSGIKSIYKSNGIGPFAFGAAGLGLSGAWGFAENGLAGAVGATAIDFGVAYQMKNSHFMSEMAGAADNTMLRPGLVNPVLKKWFGGVGQIPAGVSMSTRAYNTAAYISKGIGGGVTGAIGSTVLGKIGGAMFGTGGEITGNLVGGFLGARVGVAAVAGFGSLMTNPFTAAGTVAGLGATAALAGMAAVGVGAGYAGYKTLQAGHRYRQNQKMINTSGDLAAFSTSGAYTMRARAVQAMHKSHLNARSALGQEASLMHMPQRNYMSNYRKFY